MQYLCKMKSPYSVKLLAVITLFVMTGAYSSCSDGDDVTPTVPGGEDTATLSTTAKLLTDSIWRYYEYYQFYNDSASKLVYKSGREDNTVRLLASRVKYNTDNTYWELTGSVDTIKGTWALEANESRIKIVHNKGTYLLNLKVIGTNQLEWEDTTNNTYGLQMKRFHTTSTDKNLEVLLTAVTWKFEAYFRDYNKATAELAWRAGKANPAYNVVNNRMIFRADGTFSELTISGSRITGKWQFGSEDSQITVIPDTGTTYNLNIQLINDSRMEWYCPENNHYGEMVAIDPTE